MKIKMSKGGIYEEKSRKKNCETTSQKNCEKISKKNHEKTEILAHRKFTGRKLMVITLTIMFVVLIGFVFGIILKYQNENVIVMIVQGLFSTIASVVSIIGMFAMYYTGQKKKDK